MDDGVIEITPAAAASRLRGGAFLLDVREIEEWDAGHAPDAVHIPMADVGRDRHRLPTDREIVVVCRSGGRSACVTAALLSWGHQAVNLAGGLQEWAAAGLPVVTDTGDPGQVA